VVAQEEDRHLSGPLYNDDLGYPIVVGSGLGDEIATFVRERYGPVVILCDANPPVYAIAHRLAGVLQNASVLAFPLGEKRKRLSTVERVLDALVAEGVERTSLVLGVGGGIASDLFGFAAATYMRGVAYAHVATSLVAMVDAAIGGKTGVDLRRGKNLAGAFADPKAVFCEISALRTLPYRSLREGLAEVVKAGIIEGDDLFDSLEELSPHPFWQWPWAELVYAAAKVKTMIVADDRLESGMRELLNLGHTFGHGIEQASGYRITHGAAVAIGLRAAGLLALQTGRFNERDHLRVLTLLTLLGMPTRTTVDADAIFAAMQTDKKKRAGTLRFVLPRAIGDVEYGVTCNDRTVRSVLARLARPPEPPRARRR
jgi:3-dehydroquinate synthase